MGHKNWETYNLEGIGLMPDKNLSVQYLVIAGFWTWRKTRQPEKLQKLHIFRNSNLKLTVSRKI